jgi:hypothetical protein
MGSLAAVLLVTAAFTASPPAGAAEPAVTVTPSPGLAGQPVVVEGSGFPSDRSIFITECSSAILNGPQPKSVTDAINNCGGEQTILTADSNGNFTTTFQVVTEFVSYSGNPVSCTQPGSCAVTAAFFVGSDVFFYGQPISFAEVQTVDTVTVSPPDAVNTVGTSHTVTAYATAHGQPVAGAAIFFRVSGSTSASRSCDTDGTGHCSFTYQGPQLPGADLITACADNNHNNAADPGEPCGTATKAWVVPTSTPGQTTGGGQIWNATQTDKLAFGFTAKSSSTGVKGECSVVDPSTNTKVKCTNATVLVQGTTHATIFGDATVNGITTTYRIDVDDLGEPGAGRDTFAIQIASGYTAGGVLTNGNVQVHP